MCHVLQYSVQSMMRKFHIACTSCTKLLFLSALRLFGLDDWMGESRLLVFEAPQFLGGSTGLVGSKRDFLQKRVKSLKFGINGA